ncbi:hypothetical protein WJX72_003621 [[Myrmecia] bisecta]|uniref:Uncharacterized protein n=1 Tax=[Myrmecia] bisecta TaxID=41462 RepID=A0AAW1R5I4_9CHLO
MQPDKQLHTCRRIHTAPSLEGLAAQPEAAGVGAILGAMLAVAAVYFVYGALDVMGKLAVRFFIKDDLGSSPAEMEFWSGVQEFPFLLRPLYGFCTDAIPILGYHRKPYLIIFGIVGGLAWWSMGTWVVI